MLTFSSVALAYGLEAQTPATQPETIAATTEVAPAATTVEPQTPVTPQTTTAPETVADAPAPQTVEAPEEPTIGAQSEQTYSVASFVGYKDMFTALAKTTLANEDKSNQAALNLPTTLWVTLDDASLAAYKADHADEYAASEAARTAHNDAVAATPADPTASDPYSNVTIPEGAVQMGVTAWTCRDDYEATSYELYTFDPTLAEDFAPAEGVDLPYLEVAVGLVNPHARVAMSEADWIATVNSFTAVRNNATYSEKFYHAVSFNDDGTGSLTWQYAPTTAAAWDGTEALSCPLDTTSEAGVHIFNPTTPSELLYALHAIQADTNTGYDYRVVLQNDFDMNPVVGESRANNLWPADISIARHFTFDGNNKTIYNLYMCNNSDSVGGTGLISQVYSIDAYDLDFCGSNIIGRNSTASGNTTGTFVGYVVPASNVAPAIGPVTFTNIDVSYAVVVGRSDSTGALVGRNVEFADAEYDRIVDNCNASHVVCTGLDHVGGLMGPVTIKGLLGTTTKYVDRCYAVDATIISYGGTSKGHSGGLFSCLGGNDYGITNCFVDAQVYGQSECGVFTGAANGTMRVAIINCFSSGFVDGESQLGGFVGSSTTGQTYFFDCYSTALVGVNSAGDRVGGFLGYSGINNNGSIVGMSNCYAAGEVGNASTNSDDATQGVAHATNAGGFIGSSRQKTTTSSLAVVVNCYYDKQTTAMREYDMGNALCLSMDKVITSTDDNTYIKGIMKTTVGAQGLQGCLTTTTTKEGAGLTDSPGALPVSISAGGATVNVGFTGMRDDTACMGTYFNSASKGWADSSTAAQNAFGWDTSATEHYPELVAFSANKAGFSDEDAKVAAAYSKSSTSTIQLETWEKGLDPATGNTEGVNLSALTYDTTRDITIRFGLTQDAIDWTTTATQDGVAGSHAKSTIKGVTKDVLSILDDGVRYADQFSPGMEWLQVTTASSGADDAVSATRRLRVTPTAALDAGETKNVYETTQNPNALYDHANDVEFYFTTASRWAADNNDVTTGVYPDTSPTGTTFPASTSEHPRTPDDIVGTQRQFANGAADSLFDSFFGSSTGGNDQYGIAFDGVNKTYPGVNMSYMARNSGDAIDADVSTATNVANGSKVYTYIRPIEYFDANDNNRIVTGNILDMTAEANSDSFNGYQAFKSENTQYLIEYVWELDDGRIVRDAKIVTIKSVPFNVDVDVYESGAIDSTDAAQKTALHDTDDAYVGVVKDVTDADSVDFPNVVDNRTEDTALAGVGSHTVVGWTVTNPLKQVNRIKVDFIFEPSNDDDQSHAQHYSAVLENPKAGDTISVPYKFWRIVTLQDGTYYSIPINLDREYEVREYVVNGVTYQCLFFNMNTTDEETGIQVLDMEDDAQVDVELSEVLMLHKSIEGDYADKTLPFSFDIYYTDAQARDSMGHVGNTYTYKVWDDNGTPDKYSDDTQVVDSDNKPVTGTFTANDGSTSVGSVSLTDGQYISVLGGSADDTYRFVETSADNFTTSRTAEDGTLTGADMAWSKYETTLASASGLDTGTLTLPKLVKEDGTDADGNKTYTAIPADHSRVLYTNTYKEVVPSGISSSNQWPWVLVGIAVVAAALGGGYAVRRKQTVCVGRHLR